jgi:hypothetical protein
MTQVTSGPRAQQEHYREAERLVAAAESSSEQVTAGAVLLALVHAVLATVPRRSVPKRRGPQRRHGAAAWLFDDTDGGQR